jgi:hypothetical protein
MRQGHLLLLGKCSQKLGGLLVGEVFKAAFERLAIQRNPLAAWWRACASNPCARNAVSGSSRCRIARTVVSAGAHFHVMSKSAVKRRQWAAIKRWTLRYPSLDG